jgi:hypothetical protein
MRLTPWYLAAFVLGCFTPTANDDDELGDTEATEGECPVGSEACPCTPGGACDAGLVCLSNVCVMPATDTSTSESSPETTDTTESDTTTEGQLCGNGVIDDGEQCDGSNLGGFSCTDLGYPSGTLACDPVTCTYDATGCGTPCDPLLQDCDAGMACYYVEQGDNFLCVPTSQDIPTGEPCGFVNDCAPGNICWPADTLPFCNGSACCAAFCDLTDPVCGVMGTECVAFYGEGMAPPGYEDVGVCVLP